MSGVNASVLNVGDGTYSLVVKSELGAKNAINFDVADGYGSASNPKTSLNVFDTETSGIGAVGASIHMVQATDAHLKVDGVSIYRDSNTITDVFDGYSISPKVVNTTSFRVQSSIDVHSAYNAMNSLVSSINITKSLFGTFTMFLTSLIVVCSIGYAQQKNVNLNYFAIAFLATVLEQFSVLGIDNFIVPISSALCFNFFT